MEVMEWGQKETPKIQNKTPKGQNETSKGQNEIKMSKLSLILSKLSLILRFTPHFKKKTGLNWFVAIFYGMDLKYGPCCHWSMS